MAFGNRRVRDRRRRAAKIFLETAKWGAAIAALLGLGYWSYQGGLDLARAEVTQLEARVETLIEEVRTVRSTNAQLEDELRRARQDIALLQQRYDRDVPAGDAATLYRLAQERVAAGIPQERVEQVLRDVGPVRRCEGRGTNRRFPIAIGARVAEDAGIALLDGLLRVVVSTPGANDDMARTATVVITAAGQDPRSFTGLPQRQAVALGNVELLVSVTSEVRGFATVSVSTCTS